MDKAILAASFGTSHIGTGEENIGAIETALGESFPGYAVRRAFTSRRIIDKLLRRDGLAVDNVPQALERLLRDGCREVTVQPTTVTAGIEYDGIAAAVEPYADKFSSIRLGKPLLAGEADISDVAEAMLQALAPAMGAGVAAVLMGHGTRHRANAAYKRLEAAFRDRGRGDIYIRTAEGGEGIRELLPVLKENAVRKVILRPLMIVAGEHAQKDMAGEGEDSWRSTLSAGGFEAEAVPEGLGRIKAIRDIFVRHAKDALGIVGE